MPLLRMSRRGKKIQGIVSMKSKIKKSRLLYGLQMTMSKDGKRFLHINGIKLYQLKNDAHTQPWNCYWELIEKYYQSDVFPMRLEYSQFNEKYFFAEDASQSVEKQIL